MTLKSIWKKVQTAVVGTPPVNSMTAADVAYIGEKVRAATAFDVAAQDTRWVGYRRNVGLVADPATAPAIIAQAEDAFIAAAQERNITLTRAQVLRYVPSAAPTPSRMVQPAPKTW